MEREETVMRNKVALGVSILSFCVIFYLVGMAASMLGLPVFIDYGDSVMVTHGSGRYSYDEEVDGAMTDLGFFQLAISAMLAWRIHHLALTGSWSNGLAIESRRTWLKWVMGITAYAVLSTGLSLIEMPGLLYRCLAMAVLAAVWFFFQGRNGTGLVNRIIRT